MPREIMTRRASDNTYLHPDFHGALSCGIEYLDRTFGERAVRDYLRHFTRAYHAPLIRALRQRGLPALREYLERIYALESTQVEITGDDDEMLVRVRECPAVGHMRRQGYPVARLFVETTRTVNEALCEGTPFAAELVEHDPDTGASLQRFVRRDAA